MTKKLPGATSGAGQEVPRDEGQRGDAEELEAEDRVDDQAHGWSRVKDYITEGVNSVAKGSVGLATGAAVAQVAPAFVAATAALFMTGVVGLMLKLEAEDRKHRAVRWSARMLDAASSPAAEVWEEFQRQASDPAAGAALTASLRAALDVVDEELVDPIAALGRMYAAAGERPDRFFRGCARMLMEMDAADLVAMRIAFALGTKVRARAPHAVGLRLVTIHGPVGLRVDAVTGTTPSPHEQERSPQMENPERVVRFLGANHLGAETPVYGGVSVTVTMATAERLAIVLAPPGPPAA